MVIAASLAREMTEPPAIACHPHWLPILRGAVPAESGIEFIPVELPYTTRQRGNALDAGKITRPVSAETASIVLSIRGDFRDYLAARRIFPGARIRMTGWVRFFGRKSAVVNLPYGSGLVPVQNRYRSWASLCGVPFSQVEETYRARQSLAPRNGRVIVHLGAQWRSKQFPEVTGLRDSLERLGWSVALVAGPRDSLPADVPESAVTRPEGVDLLTTLQSAEHVFTNDSGPMHLAAFLGCRTTVIVRTSPIEEWRPPLTQVIASEQTPIGYRPHRHYMSDETLPDWPTAAAVCATLPLRRPEVPNALSGEVAPA